MKTTLALLVFASFALTGCATQPATDTPSKMVKAEYDAPITASRLPGTKVQ